MLAFSLQRRCPGCRRILVLHAACGRRRMLAFRLQVHKPASRYGGVLHVSFVAYSTTVNRMCTDAHDEHMKPDSCRHV